MKIKLIGYPYKDFKVGEICDFGEEKNASLVSLQRAVWADGGKAAEEAEIAAKAALKRKTTEEETPQEEVSQVPARNDPQSEAGGSKGEPNTEKAEEKSGKKLLENDLQQKVQKRKEQIKSAPFRGPGGKFLRKKQEEATEEQPKKGFWDKIKG